MGVVKRQSLKASIVNYAGTMLGIVTTLFLFPRIFTQEQFGVTRMLIAMTAVLYQFPLLAMPNVIIKFLPGLAKDRKAEGEFLAFANFAVGVGIVLFAVFFFVFKQQALHYFNTESNELFQSYYILVLPLVIFQALYYNFEYYCAVRLRISVPAFIRELLIRILTIVVIALYYFKLIDFDTFIRLFAAAYAVSLLAIIIYATALKYPFHWNLSFLRRPLYKEVQQYASYIYISVISLVIIAGIDQVLVGSIVGLAGLSVYFLGFTIANMIQVPYRSISQVTYPVFSEAWQHNDVDKIKRLNKDSSLNIMFIGCFLFLLLWANMDNISALLPEKYRVKELALIIFWVAAGKLFDMSMGMTEQIILTSPWYRITLILVLVQALATIVLDYFLIHMYGVVGAAIATCLTLILYNLSKLLFLWFQFRLQPYSWRGITVLLIAVAALVINYFIPRFGGWFIDAVIRTCIVSALFLSPVLYFRLSPDVNDLLKKALHRLSF